MCTHINLQDVFKIKMSIVLRTLFNAVVQQALSQNIANLAMTSNDVNSVLKK